MHQQTIAVIVFSSAVPETILPCKNQTAVIIFVTHIVRTILVTIFIGISFVQKKET